MEAIPLVETSATACAKALTFSWISHFGVPETITSNRGLQFTSNLWSQLRSMLNIAHRQTTAYHLELNGAVEKLHRRLKGALRALAPPGQLGPMSYLLYSSVFRLSRGKTLVFPQLSLFL
jgi:transposase InsO family protein